MSGLFLFSLFPARGLLFPKPQAYRINTIPQTCRRAVPIRKHMSKVTTTIGTQYFHPGHAKARILFFYYLRFVN